MEPPYAPTISTLPSRPRRRDLVALAAIQRRGNSGADGVCGATCRVGVEMSVTLGGRGLRMAEQFADNGEAKPHPRANTGE